MRCWDCKYWDMEKRVADDEGHSVARCRYYPPVHSHPAESRPGYASARWPGARHDDWCGKFEERIEGD